ncbi:MAG: DUF1549 domain-containing protein, partial [Fuerstia sp.]|nr:DUF1549 domain-containing protein [Fuerstiella sp.]
MMNKTAMLLLLWVTLQNCVVAVPADESASARVESETLFVRRISPLLREKCVGCHGSTPDKIEGSLDVSSLETLRVGGESGEPAVVSGKPDVSPLYLAATRTSDVWSAMPPKESEQLTAEQLKWLREWIASGAEWPSPERRLAIESEYAKKWSAEDGVVAATSGGLSPDWTNRKYDPAGLWAYQPVQKPSVEDPGSTGKSVIDVLIDELLPSGLTVAPRADRRTLIRRVTFDLTGLPPTPQEVNAFLHDPQPDQAAFSDVINRLLASPHYGERMAQHWLDVVRYADSSGFSNDYERGNAWRYRDYVVRSFNADKPFDQFAREQITGDEMGERQKEEGRGQKEEGGGQKTEGRRQKEEGGDLNNSAFSLLPSDLILATGFLRMGPWELTGMEVARVARQRFLDDVTNSAGETFLGHSLQCARCHDHKFDPVPTHDYYSIQAVFATTQLAERQAAFLPEENTTGFAEVDYLEQRKQEYEATLERLDEVLLRNAQAWLAEKQLSPEAWDDAVRQAKPNKSGRVFDAARSILKKQGIPEDRVPPKLVGFTPEQFGLERIARKGLERLAWEFDRYRPFALAVYAGHTRSVQAVNAPVRVPENRTDGELEPTCILTGGDPFASGQPVTPGTLSVISDQ